MVLRLLPFPDKPALQINQDAVELAEGVLERLKSGEALSVAFVEVRPGGEVATAYSRGPYYHHLNSGAATLALRLAGA